MKFGKISAEDLFESSTKKRCQMTRQHFIDIGRVEEHDQVRRHPDTCLSRVLGLAEADSLWDLRHRPASLLGDMGMCIYSLGNPISPRRVFLTDDSSYGWEILKERGWMAMSFRYRGTAHQEFDSWRAHVEHFYRGAQVIESVEDLLAHLNGEVEVAG